MTELTITVRRTPQGYRLTAAEVPGWAGFAPNPIELARALDRGFTEAEIVAYSRWRGVTPDIVEHADIEPRPPATHRHPDEPADITERVGWGKGADRRRDCHAAGDWTPLPDGQWLSPAGRRFPPDRAIVASVIARREAAGLPTSYAS